MANAKTATKNGSKNRTAARSIKKSATGAAGAAAGDEQVTIDRRRASERRDEVCEAVAETAGPKLERRKKVNRRRQIDPTTCERDYTDQEVEFMNALDDYKRKSGRMFPTCSEVLEVINSLGYVKLSPAEINAMRGLNQSTASAKPMTGEWSDASVLTSIESQVAAASHEC